MREMRSCMKTIVVLVLLVSLMLLGSDCVLAEPTTGSLKLSKATAGSTFALYQVQIRESDGTFTTTQEFAEYPIDWNPETANDLRALASTLRSYILADHPQAYRTGIVAEDGTISFTELPLGLYLALGEEARRGNARIGQAPVIAYIPGTDDEQKAIYDLEAEIKPEQREETEYQVRKIWEDKKSSERPDSIRVSLYQDGKAYDTVTLSKENSWQHSWKQLPAGCTYSVKEETKVDGYTVSVEEEAGIFFVRNTKKTPPPENPPKTPPENPPKQPKLPQTGQLWWPVLVMTALGLMFLVLGKAARKKRR